MSEDIATIGIKADTRDLKRGERALGGFASKGEATERRVSKSSRLMSAGMATVGRAAGVLGLALSAALGVGAVAREVGTFETAMSGVAAVTRATQQDLALMRDTALQLGSTTEFSAAQAADGLRFLGMAGFSASEAVAALPDTLDLATASGMGLAQAADIASNVLSGFGLQAGQAGDVADVLAAASSRANTDVSQLGRAMSTVAPIAASLGVSVEDTAAAIGVMSDAGIQGERAGTALRGVMAALAGPTTQAQDALAKYGLTAADVDPATRSLADIMDTLAASGLSTADAMTIFGREAASGALALQGASERLGEFSTELRDVEGAASDMAGVMRDNLQGDVTGLQSAVSGLLIALGDAGLTSAIRGVVQALTDFVRGASLVIGQLSDIAGGVQRLFSEQARLEKQIDNSRIALNDEARAIGVLDEAMSGGISMSVGMAQQKLNEAMARRENIRAIIEEQRALKMGTAEYQNLSSEIEYLNTQTDALRNQPRSAGNPMGRGASDLGFAQMPFEIQQQVSALGELARARQELLDPTGETADLFSTNAQNIERLQRGLDNAVDGMVTFEGETITAVEATERLNTAISGQGGAGGPMSNELDRINGKLSDASIASERWANSMAGHFDGLITGGKDFSGVLMSIARQLESSAWQSLFSGNLFGGGGGGGLFSGIGSFFSGLFDQGGTIPAGGVGIVGERGPEFVRGPAHVTSRADTARAMQGNGGGQVVIKLDLSRDVEARIMRNTSGQAVQIVSSALGANRQALPGQIDTISNRGE